MRALRESRKLSVNVVHGIPFSRVLGFGCDAHFTPPRPYLPLKFSRMNSDHGLVRTYLVSVKIHRNLTLNYEYLNTNHLQFYFLSPLI